MGTYFESNRVKIYLGDAVETLSKLLPESVDLIFADPPYKLSNGGFTCHAGQMVSVDKGSWDVSNGIEEDFNFHYKWIEACRRVLKPDGSLWISGTYHSIYACGYVLQRQGWHILNDICWYKPNAAPNLSCRMFTASHETLLWAKKDKDSVQTFNYEDMKHGSFPGDLIKKKDKQMRSIWVVGTPKNDEKKYGKHPTQKPELLLDRIIMSSSNEGDTVLDPFCGSATTGVVALRHNRRFIGVDLEQDYLENIAVPRLKDIIYMNKDQEPSMERAEAIKKLRGLVGREIHQLAQELDVTIERNGKANKGWAGHVFERFLGLPINSSQSPNFGSWELKSIPLKTLQNGSLTFKETMAITMIDPVEVCQKEFEESHLFAKLQKVVIVSRTVGSDFREPSYVHSVTEFSLTGELYDAVKADYDLIRDALRDPEKGFDFLTGKMGKFIQPRTKGAGHGSKSRAFYARPIFLKQFIDL